MEVKDLKRVIDDLGIKVCDNDAYLTVVKVGENASISFEGNRSTMLNLMVNLMQKYKDFASIVCEASDIYYEEEL